jgi:hypothetical protein
MEAILKGLLEGAFIEKTEFERLFPLRQWLFN